MSVKISMDMSSGRSRSAGSGDTILSSMNVARLVQKAFKKGSVGPKMLGLKQKSNVKNSLSLNDLAFARQVVETERKMYKSEHSKQLGTRAVFTFVQPTEKLRISYREQQARIRRAMQRSRHLQDGALLDTLEKGVSYPVMHVDWSPGGDKSNVPGIAIHSSPSSHLLRPETAATTMGGGKFNAGSDVKTQGLSSSSSAYSSRASSMEKELADVAVRPSYWGGATKDLGKTDNADVRIMDEDALGKHFCVQQGLYEEVKRIEPDIQFSPRDNPDDRAFIFLGFKTLDTGFSSVLESTWRDWTGARAIYLKLHDQFDLSKIIFYHRVKPVVNLDLFMYIVVVECWNVNNSNLIHILDFVQRMRVERLNGYISLYRDLGSLDEVDSNYHSGSQESLSDRNSIRSSVSPHGLLTSTKTRTTTTRPESHCSSHVDHGVDMASSGHESDHYELVDDRRHREGIYVTEKTSTTEYKTRVVETLTIERQPSITFPAID